MMSPSPVSQLQPKLPSYVARTYSNLPSLLSVAPPQPAQTLKRAQVEESAQEFTQNDVSRLRELAVVKAMCPSVCVSAFLYMLDITHRMSLAARSHP